MKENTKNQPYEIEYSSQAAGTLEHTLSRESE